MLTWSGCLEDDEQHLHSPQSPAPSKWSINVISVEEHIPRWGAPFALSWEVKRKAMPKNAQTTSQLHSSHMLARRRQWHPTPVLLLGKSHGWRSLVGCSPWGRYESDTTEQLPFHFSLSCIGEGNGNPLQCSCLENPWDRGAWWASVYGVAQSRTWLKQLRRSSSSI